LLLLCSHGSSFAPCCQVGEVQTRVKNWSLSGFRALNPNRLQYRRFDIMRDRGHVVYTILLSDQNGRKCVYVEQTKQFHDRMSQHKLVKCP
jgi:hypothetical protein